MVSFSSNDPLNRISLHALLTGERLAHIDLWCHGDGPIDHVIEAV